MKRYNIYANGGGVTREECPTGSYVRYADVIALEAVVEAARGMLQECKDLGSPLIATLEKCDAALAKIDESKGDR